MDPDNSQVDKSSDDSLEAPSTVVENAPVEPSQSESAASSEPAAAPSGDNVVSSPPRASQDAPHQKKRHRLNFSGFNIYLIGFAIVFLTAATVVGLALRQSKKSLNQTPVQSQNLTQSQLQQLANSDVTVGSNNQVLNVAANAVFGNQVLVRQDLDVGGNLKVGNSLSLPGLTVAGGNNVQFQTSKLTISGDNIVGGQLSVNKNLTVAGNSNFGGTVSIGQLVVQTLQLNGALSLTNHLTLGGSTPAKAGGSALGSGGTASVSGSDSSGSISINTGSSTSAGCFVTINFSSAFNATPHVVVTPIGSGAAGLAFYVNRSTSSFSVCTTSTPPANQSFGFDYLVLD